MPQPQRPLGGVRSYGAKDLTRVCFIKAAQRWGFSLDEVADPFKLYDGTHCGEARALAQIKLQHVRERLLDLQRIESVLGQLVARCDSARDKLKCPLTSSLQVT